MPLGSTVPYLGSSTSRGLSSMWNNCPVAELLAGNPALGWMVFDDFVRCPNVVAGSQANSGLYKGFADTGGLVQDSDEVGGVLNFSSDGDNEGASLAMINLPFQINDDQSSSWFEARIKTSTIADTKHGWFFGLLDSATLSATVPIAAAGTLADENFVGWHRLEGDGDKADFVYKADSVTQVTLEADAATLVADTWIRLGFHYDGPSTKLYWHVDGVVSATTFTMVTGDGTDFPNDVRMGLVFALLNATGSTPGSTDLDWWAAAQLSAT